jgi:hypothetical protein
MHGYAQRWERRAAIMWMRMALAVGGEADVGVDGFGVGCEVRLCVGDEASLCRCYCQVSARV